MADRRPNSHGRRITERRHHHRSDSEDRDILVVHRRSRHVPAGHGGDRAVATRSASTRRRRSAPRSRSRSATARKSIYKGEVVGLEPIYKGGEKTHSLIRAMNKLHRLLRKRKSITFTDKTDQQILNQVVGDAGLSLEWKHEKIDHVQARLSAQPDGPGVPAHARGAHGLSRLVRRHEGLRASSRICSSSRSPSSSVDQTSATAALHQVFTPRLSSAAIVKKVTVKGWNPETKELITGDCSVQSSKLGCADRGRRLRRARQRRDVHRRSSDLEQGGGERRSRRRASSISRSATSPARARSSGDPSSTSARSSKIVANAEPETAATIRSTASTTSWASPTATSLTKTKDGGLRHHPSPRARRAEGIAMRAGGPRLESLDHRAVRTALRHRLSEQGSG